MRTPLTLAGSGAAALALLLFFGFANDPGEGVSVSV